MNVRFIPKRAAAPLITQLLASQRNEESDIAEESVLH
jgi:hypothetical protein